MTPDQKLIGLKIGLPLHHRDVCDYIDTTSEVLERYIRNSYKEHLSDSEVIFLLRQTRLQSQWMYECTARVLETQTEVWFQLIRKEDKEEK